MDTNLMECRLQKRLLLCERHFCDVLNAAEKVQELRDVIGRLLGQVLDFVGELLLLVFQDGELRQDGGGGRGGGRGQGGGQVGDLLGQGGAGGLDLGDLGLALGVAISGEGVGNIADLVDQLGGKAQLGEGVDGCCLDLLLAGGGNTMVFAGVVALAGAVLVPAGALDHHMAAAHAAHAQAGQKKAGLGGLVTGKAAVFLP